MASYDTIIKGGMIVDGTRAPRYRSDMAIKDGKIVQIGGLKGASAAKVLDATGLIVAPGFVDLHTHYDAQIFWDPYCTLSGWHGVTSVAIGNCGFGFAPSRPEDKERAMLALTRNEAIPLKPMQLGMPWDWVTFPEFLESLDRVPKGLNLLSYQPLTPLYAWVMGWDEAKKRRPNEGELKEMCRLVHEAMDAGACGWSAQVAGSDSAQRDYDGTPMITDLMTPEEILAFAQVLGDRDEGFIQMSYREPDEGTESKIEYTTKEMFEKAAEVAGRPILYQSVQGNPRRPEVHRERIQWLAECAQRGLRVYGQGSTNRGGNELTFEDYNLFDQIPAWREVTLGTVAEKKAKMQDPENRRKLRESWDKGERPGILKGSVGGLIVQKVYHEEFNDYIGRTVTNIGEMEGKHIIDALLDLVVSEDLRTEFLGPVERDDPECTAEVLNSPHVIPGISDGGAHLKFVTNGSFPTDTLAWMVRDEQRLSLEDAHYKLSYLPAFMGGFKDRGVLREGAPADIVVYDLDNLKLLPKEVAHDLPGGEWRRIQKAEGYRWIMVNGEVTFEDGVETGALPGKVLRHGKG